MDKIIIVEDEEIIRNELKIFLEKYGYIVDAPNSFDDIINYILNQAPSLILLDLNLPIFDGYYICREIRKNSNVPIIIVTSRNTDIDELMGINLGADDFITKPYNTQILLARINSLLKRANKNISNIIKCNDFELNLSNATVKYQNNFLELTKNELKILSFLMENKGSIVTRENLMEYLWSSEYFVDDATLNVNITRLRKKLEQIGIYDLIQTKRGLGYIIQ